MEEVQFRDIFWLLREFKETWLENSHRYFFVDLEIQSLVYDTEVHRLKEKEKEFC